MKITNLTCENMVRPLSVSVSNPSFSWMIEAEEENIFQSAYEIRVWDENGREIWNTGKVESSETIGIRYEGESLKSLSEYSYQVRIWNQKDEWAESEKAGFETALRDAAEWTANWIEPEALPQLPKNPLEQARKVWDDQIAAIMRGEQVEMRIEGDIVKELPVEPYDPAVSMRKTFEAKKDVVKARLYITSHGIYDAKINGREVTDSLLNPGFTTYNKRIQYQSFDVKDLLQESNAIHVTVADGWYKGKIAFGRGCEYGEVPGLLMELHIWYADGSKDVIVTDDSWKYSYDGPVRKADLFYGELYDARNVDGDPSLVFYEDDWWKKVLVRDKPDETLEAQSYPLAKVFEHVTAKRIWTSPKGETLVDFGQNFAGILEVRIHGEKGEEIVFDHGEELDPEGNYFYTLENSTQPQKDTYICNGDDEEVFKPKFTYHGFRYVRVTGGKDWKKEQFTALAISTENPVTGSFSCSDPSLNQLQHNIYWSQRSNNITIPTDCPTREKAGWTGDVVVYGASALYNQQMTEFYKSWLKSIRVEQYENGHILGTVPQINCYISQTSGGSLGWGDVILTLPWQLYELYGDKTVLEDNYEAMGKWLSAMKAAAYELPTPYNTVAAPQVDVTSMTGRQLDNQHYLINSGFHFGDWIIPSVVNEQGFTDGPMSAYLTMNYADTALLAHISDLYAKISRLLGHTDNAEIYEAYGKRVREAFAEEYVTSEGKLGQEMQGNYILALKYHMVSGEMAVKFAERLKELIAANGYRLDTGFMSTPHLLDVLCDYGYEDVAWKVLFQRQCPSWLYEVDHGATTMWENWDAIRVDGQRNECSFNHYAFGCVGDFLYRRVLGIQNAGLAYDEIRIAPEYHVPLTEVSGSYMSARGNIELTWGKVEQGYFIKGSIPANTKAVIVLPNGEQQQLTNGSFFMTV
ncbi:MAG: family 78 glycoside hydrolase catalytic domain [Eubacteriales bacterium]|nr:family 78 glycoside hydrolase catalytic domain [Eubacteriales bacterium]